MRLQLDEEVGLYIWRYRVLLLASFLILAPALLLTNKILVNLGQNEEASKIAWRFSRDMLPSALLSGLIEMDRRTIECYGLGIRQRLIFICLQLGYLCSQLGLMYLFVVKLELGMGAIALGFFLNNLLLFLGQSALITSRLEFTENHYYQSLKLFDVLDSAELLKLRRQVLPQSFSWFVRFCIFDVVVITGAMLSLKDQACIIFCVA